MNQKYLLVVLLVLAFANGYACEICGCGNSNFQIGLLPNFNKGFAGFRYSYAKFHSRMTDEPSEFSYDRYQAMEIWGGYNFKRLQVMAFMPYITTRKESDDGIVTSSGAGDLMLLVSYNVLPLSTGVASPRQELFLGGGIKLPTGQNTVDISDPEMNVGDFNSQPGTGSVDYLLNASYNLAWERSGIVSNAAYRINSSNDKNYRFGNRIYLNSVYYRTFAISTVEIKPNAGLNFQQNDVNTFDGDEVEGSNGYNLSSVIGINVVRGKFGFSATAFIPVAQNSFDGQTKMDWRLMTGVSFSF